MYKKFIIDIKDIEVFLQSKHLLTEGRSGNFSKNASVIERVIYVRGKYYPKVDADIFISHSHADKNIIDKFSNKLKQHFGISTFIDSNFWEHFRNFLNPRIGVTSDIAKKALSASLQEMIDCTECFFFINSPNASANGITSSEFIYNELETAAGIKIREPENNEFRAKIRGYISDNLKSIHGELIKESKDKNFSRRINTDGLYKLNSNSLHEWLEVYNANSELYGDITSSREVQEIYPRSLYALDVLYVLTNV